MKIPSLIAIIVLLMIAAGGIGYFLSDGLPVVINLEQSQKDSIRADEASKCNIATLAEEKTTVKNCKANLTDAQATITKLEKSRESAWAFVNGNSTAISDLEKSIVDMNKNITKSFTDVNKSFIDMNAIIIREC